MRAKRIGGITERLGTAWLASYRRFGGGPPAHPDGSRTPLPRRPRIPYIYTVYAPRLRRAALPLQLPLPARRVASGGAGRARAGARLRGARDHRRMLGRRRRARASRREGRRAAAHRSAASSRSTTARSSCCSPPTAQSYGDLVAADHARAAQRGQGHATRSRATTSRLAGVALPRAVDAARSARHGRDDAARATTARWIARRVRRARAWIARRAVRARRRRARGSPRCAALGRAHRPAAGRRGRRAHARARAARAAGHADRDPPAHAARRNAATRCIPTASGTCARARGSRRSIRRALTDATLDARASAARSRSTSCATSIRDEIVPRGRDARVAPAQAHRAKARAALWR